MSTEYPYADGDVIVIGPECFINPNMTVICFHGVNFYRRHTADGISVMQQPLVERMDNL